MIDTPDTSSTRYIDVVFDGPAAHESGRFVEVEDETGASIKVGEWFDRGNGLRALRLPTSAKPDTLITEMMEWVRGERSHWNSICDTSGNRLAELQTCAVMDAQEVVKLAAAINALTVARAARA